MMKKIIETVAEGGGELGVHMYPFVSRRFDVSAFLFSSNHIFVSELANRLKIHLPSNVQHIFTITYTQEGLCLNFD